MRWFKEPLAEGALKGSTLDYEKYNDMLSTYYEMRGWDDTGNTEAFDSGTARFS